MIQISNLVKEYMVNNQTVPILKGLNCTIEEGEFVTILGPSGCGKSTLLNILAGLMKADGGDININGKSTKEYNDADWDNWRKEQIGIVFQNFQLIPHLSALENVELAMCINAYDKRTRRKRAKELLQKVGLGERMKNKPNQLSGGQKQRVAIARALANSPKIILADEPTGALDSATSKEIMELLHLLNEKEGVTIIMVTHDEDIAAQADKNIRMLDGEIVDVISCKNPIKKEIHKQKETMSYRKGGMKWKDSIEVAVHNILVKKKRFLLTVAGITVGIFSVVAMMGITNGLSQKVADELDALSNASQVRIVTEGKEQKDIDELKAKLMREEVIDRVENVYQFSGMLAYKDEYSEEFVYSRNTIEHDEELLFGSYPETNTQIAVSKGVAEKFVGEENINDILGKEITVYVAYVTEESMAYAIEKSCTVVGITDVNIFGIGNNYINYAGAEVIAEESLGQKAEPQRAYAYLSGKEHREEIVNIVESANFEVASSEDLIDTINTWIAAIKGFLLLITGISLVVATVMVVIVQYMSVAERMREIGILRAIGAQKKDIKTIFLLEAGIIGVIAGTLGIVTAGWLGNLINGVIFELMQTGAFAVYQTGYMMIIVSLLISIGLCLLAGYMPAKQAASVDAIEVLR